MTFGSRNKKGVPKNNSRNLATSRQSSVSEALFSSEGDPTEKQSIGSNFYEEFVSREDFEEEIEEMKQKVTLQIINEARVMV